MLRCLVLSSLTSAMLHDHGPDDGTHGLLRIATDEHVDARVVRLEAALGGVRHLPPKSHKHTAAWGAVSCHHYVQEAIQLATWPHLWAAHDDAGPAPVQRY